jgi:superfamily I DNA and/or RNA helicase
VAATIDHLLNRPGQSLGVIALSLPQRDLILELLEQALRDNPAAARAYQYWQGWGEVPFVSSLETLQGDERDAISISGTAGPDPQGQFEDRILRAAQEY